VLKLKKVVSLGKFDVLVTDPDRDMSPSVYRATVTTVRRNLPPKK
jgi:hypothetical protein